MYSKILFKIYICLKCFKDYFVVLWYPNNHFQKYINTKMIWHYKWNMKHWKKNHWIRFGDSNIPKCFGTSISLISLKWKSCTSIINIFLAYLQWLISCEIRGNISRYRIISRIVIKTLLDWSDSIICYNDTTVDKCILKHLDAVSSIFRDEIYATCKMIDDVYKKLTFFVAQISSIWQAFHSFCLSIVLSMFGKLQQYN